MKKITLIVAFLAFVMAPSQGGASQSPQQTQKTQKAKQLYICPMHPEVTSTKPGICPKCKMDLVKVEPKKTPAKKIPGTNTALQQSKPKPTGEKSAQTRDTIEKNGAEKTMVKYTCPMHPDVVSDTPGKCPRCHMDLVIKNNDK
ncbi:MAG TPA: heavy metal-binding domain-containing protein [Bacteroidota bacterium]|nr:heavy metal-binding domain-containing protein [Bacteroidota bacterium]